MNVLMSIKPEYAEKILNGDKKFEFRKILPKNREVAKVIIYATLPVGKVIGEFEISDFISTSPSELWQLTKKSAGITKSFFDDYFNDRETAHAIRVGVVKRYKKEKLLEDFLKSNQAPQSFCYIN
ncbi:hypothetical protein BGI32_05715 [Snodgrassella alvi]|uniref:ASCH domain-containing protein n=1 Tax=Snodgrassella alvi TaxID=1196083 RepID=A0A2N9WU10_9NEIS|nr:ASCH domain-containing protein [Snodgrassella alvi]PIT15425.1 hypothetical protein BGI32_05715 [Snodgrassella alvi]